MQQQSLMLCSLKKSILKHNCKGKLHDYWFN
uniref:Uncharacterized protein n=1 Tax=Arundo donax TaxID=35708 RepID=A0A0A8YZM4_ARUDO